MQSGWVIFSLSTPSLQRLYNLLAAARRSDDSTPTRASAHKCVVAEDYVRHVDELNNNVDVAQQ